MTPRQDGYMYILACCDGSYYTGSTPDINRSLLEHQTGKGASFTRFRLPVKLVYCKYFIHLSDAFAYKKQVQGWSRKKKEALMHGQFELLHELAKCQNSSISSAR